MKLDGWGWIGVVTSDRSHCGNRSGTTLTGIWLNTQSPQWHDLRHRLRNYVSEEKPSHRRQNPMCAAEENPSHRTREPIC
jgi:hypothetical protein